MLHTLSPEIEASCRIRLENREGHNPKKARKKREAKAEPDAYGPDQDERYYFIAGYTSGGAPYGITWDEARAQGLIDEDE